MRKFSETSSNQFFKNNSVKSIPRATSYSAFADNNQRKLINDKETTSKVKINPHKFMHREVFNTKLYQADVPNPLGVSKRQKSMKKFFQISLTKKDRINGQLGDQQGQYIIQSNKHITQNKYWNHSQMEKSWKALLHHFNILDKLIRFVDPKDPFKMTLKGINENLETFFSSIFSQYDKLLLKYKQIMLNITSLNRDPLAVQNQKKCMLESQNFSWISKGNNDETLIKTLKQKINCMEFQNKKLMLFSSKLQEDLKVKTQELNHKESECNNLIKRFQKIEEEREGYEFKIKKLKEELEVAHIIKEQNLADKVNYILGWKL